MIVLLKSSAWSGLYLSLAWLVAANWSPPDTGRALLVDAGVEIQLLDDVRNGTLQAFVEDENELFRQLARAMIHFESDQPRAPAGNFDLLKALQQPQDYRGSYVAVQGTVRRITPIQITLPRMQQAIGRSEYYQVDLFVSTRQTSFQLKDQEGQVAISGTYGITLILFELPEVFLQDKPAMVTVPGFYLKNWLHKTVETRDVSDEMRRPNPIVFGIGSLTEPVDLQSGRRTIDAVIGWFWGGLILLLAALGLWQWRTARQRKLRLAEKTVTVDLSDLE